AKDGWQVTVYDKNSKPGGVCALAEKNGYKWEQGPLILGDMLPGEPVYELLKDLGITLDTVRADRGIEMRDYTMWHPDEYEGPYWRRERLKKLFPDEASGIDAYYRFYDAMLRLRYLGGLQASHPTLLNKLRLALAFLKIKKYAGMNAQQLVETFFHTPKLQALFTGILCDFCASPEEATALSVPFTNFETAFDKRIPLEKNGRLYNPGYVNIIGGVQKLPEALADVIVKHGGTICLNTVVDKVLIENGCAVGVQLADGMQVPADLVVGSGGGRDFFEKAVGLEHLDDRYREVLSTFRPMEAVFMVHLGVDYDPMQFMKSALCYYYKTDDIPAAVKRMREGVYHEGDDGFLIYVPTVHAPDFAPEGRHCVTIYTVAPDRPTNGDWATDRERWADHLIELAQQHLPGLREHITERLIMTALEYRQMTHMDKCSFGGVVPIMNQKNPPHRTPVGNLWFVGQQSENAGGVGAVILGAKETFRQFKEQKA
ncbi:MAG: NAD(P)/FAD-dependent oxidoreductase, partial [Clostridia bacterium]|nr:NAD(P)/FAD-dependent oxidoreductase [Clostridia bacterium]